MFAKKTSSMKQFEPTSQMEEIKPLSRADILLANTP